MVIEFDEIEMFDEVLAMYQGPKTKPWNAMAALLADAQRHAKAAGMDWDELLAAGRMRRGAMLRET